MDRKQICQKCRKGEPLNVAEQAEAWGLCFATQCNYFQDRSWRELEDACPVCGYSAFDCACGEVEFVPGAYLRR